LAAVGEFRIQALDHQRAKLASGAKPQAVDPLFEPLPIDYPAGNARPAEQLVQ
jgi:hypothetical protein